MVNVTPLCAQGSDAFCAASASERLVLPSDPATATAGDRRAGHFRPAIQSFINPVATPNERGSLLPISQNPPA